MLLKHAVYSPHPSILHRDAILRNLEDKTGRGLDEWLSVLGNEGLTQCKQAVVWLKSKAGMGGVTAQIIGFALENGTASYEEDPVSLAPDLVEAMYANKKSGLIPIHNALMDLVQTLESVRICPCNTMVPCYRNHVFAQIKPATQKRIDFGLALKAVDGELPGQLMETGGLQKGDRITHRFPLTHVDQVNGEVKALLQKAWALDG